MSQRAIRWLTLLLVISAVLPVAAVFLWSYVDARQDVRRDMLHVSTAARDRLDSVFDYGSNQLQVLGNLTDTLAEGCDNNAMTELRDIVFRSPYFREAGLLYDDAMFCNQYDRFTPPVNVAQRLRNAVQVDGLFVAVHRVPESGPISLILARRYGNRATGYVIVHPGAMTDFLPFFEPNANHGVFFLYDNRVTLSAVGGIDVEGVQSLLDNDEATGSSGHDSIYALARSQRYPVAVAAISKTHLALTRWRNRLPWIVLAAFGLAIGTFFLTRKLATAALSMQAELARAISSGRLTVEYQPFFDANKTIVVGVEALVRWNSRREGPLSPAVFVPLAEQMGLLPALTEFVFQRTMEDLGSLLQQYPQLRVTINCHVSTINEPMLTRFAQQWTSAGFEPRRLVFEVTERANAHFDAQSIKPSMDTLKARGMRFAMDDFGVGFSNLNSLRSLPFDFLKIDKTFVDGISADATDSAGFVTQIVDLAKRLNLILIAEGVETQVQLDYLRSLGVQFMQGWYFAKAMPANTLALYLSNYRKKQPAGAPSQAQAG